MVENEFKRIVSDAKVEVVSDNKCIVYVPESNMARIIGKQGTNIMAMEEKLGMKIDVQPLGAEKATSGVAIEYGSKITRNSEGIIVITYEKKLNNDSITNPIIFSNDNGENWNLKFDVSPKIFKEFLYPNLLRNQLQCRI